MLAARASAGGVSLWQVRGPDACLCVGSGDCEPLGCHSKLDIQPGYFKYGWYAEPQRFATAVPESTTSAAASAAQKAMQGIAMASKPTPPDLKRYSSSSGADMSSQSTDFMYRSSSMTPSAPIAIGSKDSSNDDSLVSSMYTETVMEGSVTSDASMLTAKTNKTRRGKRGGKKQRENSQLRRMQSVPQSVSPMLVSGKADTAIVALAPLHVCMQQALHTTCHVSSAKHSSHACPSSISSAEPIPQSSQIVLLPTKIQSMQISMSMYVS